MATEPKGMLERMLYEASDGRIRLDTKPNLIPVADALPAVAQGLADMSMVSVPHFTSSYPLLDYASVPGIAENLYEMDAITSDPRMFKLLDDLYRGIDIQYLCTLYSEANDAVWMKDTLVDTVDKFSGLKARTSGLLQTKTLEALGASAMTIAGTELETALIQGTVDAITTSLTYGWGRGFTDICDYAALWPITPGYFFSLVMNGDKFDSLPSDLQQIMLDTTAEMSHRQIFAMNAQLGTAMKAIGLTKCEIVYPSDVETAKAKELVKVVRDDYIEVAGPDGQKILDVIDDAVAKYRALLESL